MFRPPLLGAEASHAEPLAAIHAAARPGGEQWTAATIAMLLDLPGVFGLLDPAGAMLLARRAADQAEILALAVVPSARRAGRARALLAAAEARAKENGVRELFLEVAASNAAARALYAAAGYREAARRRRYYRDGDDALVLRKLLTPEPATAA